MAGLGGFGDDAAAGNGLFAFGERHLWVPPQCELEGLGSLPSLAVAWCPHKLLGLGGAVNRLPQQACADGPPSQGWRALTTPACGHSTPSQGWRAETACWPHTCGWTACHNTCGWTASPHHTSGWSACCHSQTCSCGATGEEAQRRWPTTCARCLNIYLFSSSLLLHVLIFEKNNAYQRVHVSMTISPAMCRWRSHLNTWSCKWSCFREPPSWCPNWSSWRLHLLQGVLNSKAHFGLDRYFFSLDFCWAGQPLFCNKPQHGKQFFSLWGHGWKGPTWSWMACEEIPNYKEHMWENAWYGLDSKAGTARCFVQCPLE